MDFMQEYSRWLNDEMFDDATKQELRGLENDENEIRERFYKNLEFGTGGLRGILGAGTNRMNIYTVRKATQGLANYIIKQGTTSMGVVIAHDCRHMSPEFCLEAALVLCANGIKASIFEGMRPTPELSFAVRHLGATAGIVITASHNPPEYNGYKVYWADGGQTPFPRDGEIINEVDAVDFSAIKTMKRSEAEQAGMLTVLGAEVDDAFITNVKGQSIHPEIIKDSDLSIVYTPLHGTGLMPVRRALTEMGFKHLYTVHEQEVPDPNFSTVDYPNPEDPKAFTMAIELAKQKNADIVVGTDPDADRVGVVVREADGSYTALSGNMTGVILTEYIISQRKATGTLPENPAVISTIVSTDMTKAIADAYGVGYVNTLTGFKWFGAKMKEWEDSGAHNYVFGFEESYGCSSGTYCRDKDSVVTTMLICEAAAFYRKQNKSLADVINEMYEKYGYYMEENVSVTLKGIEGVESIKRIMANMRKNPLTVVYGKKVDKVTDYLEKTDLPISDVLYYNMEDGSWFAIRPSGTEPKIKVYMGVKSTSKDAARDQLAGMGGEIKALLQ